MDDEADEPKPAAEEPTEDVRDKTNGTTQAETSEVPKTEAQLERARRKKQQQKAKKRKTTHE
jgi:hypothetical protein